MEQPRAGMDNAQPKTAMNCEWSAENPHEHRPTSAFSATAESEATPS